MCQNLGLGPSTCNTVLSSPVAQALKMESPSHKIVSSQVTIYPHNQFVLTPGSRTSQAFFLLLQTYLFSFLDPFLSIRGGLGIES